MSTLRPSLLYLPGIEGTGRLLFRQPELQERYDVQCAAYPQDRPQTYLSLAQDAARLVTAPSIVLAESFGGAVALTLALERPDLVERLVLVNTFAWFPKRALIHFSAWLGRFAPTRPGPLWTRPIRERFFFSPQIPRDVRDEWWRRVGQVPLRGFGYRLPLIANLDLRARLPEITKPALVLVSPDDRVVPPSAGYELGRLLPHARVIEVRAGHAAIVHPDASIAQLIQSF